MRQILAILLMAVPCLAEVPISSLPSFSGSDIGSTDTVPFVHKSTNTTGQLKFSQILSIPSVQDSPTFTGTLSVPTGSFSKVAVLGANGTYQQHYLNTVSAAYANCGTLSGATGCVKIFINGATHYIPYW